MITKILKLLNKIINKNPHEIIQTSLDQLNETINNHPKYIKDYDSVLNSPLQNTYIIK